MQSFVVENRCSRWPGCAGLTFLSCSLHGHFRLHGAERDVGFIWPGAQIHRVALREETIDKVILLHTSDIDL